MTIHYFKEGELPYDYIGSWRKYAPDAELKLWNASMLPYDWFPALEEYRRRGMWSVLSDFVRLWAVYKEGGIYLDCDVELVKDIRHLFELEAFICQEGEPVYVNAAVTGGKKGSKHHAAMLDGYFDVLAGRKRYDAPFEVACGVWSHTDYVASLLGRRLGRDDLDSSILVDDLLIMPKRAFYPYNWNETYSPECIKDSTYGVHWWKKSWDK